MAKLPSSRRLRNDRKALTIALDELDTGKPSHLSERERTLVLNGIRQRITDLSEKLDALERRAEG